MPNLTQEELDAILKDNPQLSIARSPYSGTEGAGSKTPETRQRATSDASRGTGRVSGGLEQPRKIDVVIPFAPVAKGRPRITVQNGKAHAYTPGKTSEAENSIRWVVREQKMFNAGIPLRLRAEFVIARPKTVKAPYPVTRPDLDNYVKTLMDALNGYAFSDDSQVVELCVSKLYCLAKAGEHINLRIEVV